MLLGSHAVTNQPTCDQAMNPVMASAMFDIAQFTADISIVLTRADMSPTFPTKVPTLNVLGGHPGLPW